MPGLFTQDTHIKNLASIDGAIYGPSLSGTTLIFREFLFISKESDNDPHTFWIEELKRQKYSLIKMSGIAVDVLCIVASSAPSERVFSTAGDSLMNRRHNMKAVHIEREVLLRLNKKNCFP